MAQQVEFFGQWMTPDWAEALREAQLETHYVDDEGRYRRVPFGAETFLPEDRKREPCRHCSTLLGKLHAPDCDYEQCPKCHYQIMSCDCEFRGHEWRETAEE